MNRICEEVQYLDVFAPQAVATVRGDRGRYVGVTFQHDAGSEVDCAVLAAVRPMYRPPENSWQLVV